MTDSAQTIDIRFLICLIRLMFGHVTSLKQDGEHSKREPASLDREMSLDAVRLSQDIVYGRGCDVILSKLHCEKTYC